MTFCQYNIDNTDNLPAKYFIYDIVQEANMK